MLGFKPAQSTVLSLTAMSFERPSVISVEHLQHFRAGYGPMRMRLTWGVQALHCKVQY